MKNILNLDYYSTLNNSNNELYTDFPEPKFPPYEPKGYKSDTPSMVLGQLGLQVTENCNLRCTYCYQQEKTPKKLTFDECKFAIDMVLGLINDKDKYCKFILVSPFRFHLIGGEPLLEDELCYNCIKYFDNQIKNNNINLDWYIWIPTNGIPYFSEYSQKIVNEYGDRLSLPISMDGCKECHDACRLYPNGKGSYEDTRKAFDAYKSIKGKDIETKFTISPYNIQYYSKSIIDWIDEGVYRIFSNWELEDYYSPELANEYYKESKKAIDYIINNNLENIVHYSVLNKSRDTMTPVWKMDQICGAKQSLAIIPGEIDNIYPCVRLASSSLDKDTKPLPIGSLEKGVCYNSELQRNFDIISGVTRKSYSNYQCYNCPLTEICYGCMGNDYNKGHFPIRKQTTGCNMYIADNLARAYGINKIYRKKESLDKDYFFKSYKVTIPMDLAIPIVGESEYRLIKYLAKESI